MSENVIGEVITDEIVKVMLDITTKVNPETMFISRPEELRKYYENKETHK